MCVQKHDMRVDATKTANRKDKVFPRRSLNHSNELIIAFEDCTIWHTARREFWGWYLKWKIISHPVTFLHLASGFFGFVRLLHLQTIIAQRILHVSKCLLALRKATCVCFNMASYTYQYMQYVLTYMWFRLPPPHSQNRRVICLHLVHCRSTKQKFRSL